MIAILHLSHRTWRCRTYSQYYSCWWYGDRMSEKMGKPVVAPLWQEYSRYQSRRTNLQSTKKLLHLMKYLDYCHLIKNAYSKQVNLVCSPDSACYFSLTIKKILLTLCEGIHPWLMDSLQKGPVMQKAFSCHDIITVTKYPPRWSMVMNNELCNNWLF